MGERKCVNEVDHLEQENELREPLDGLDHQTEERESIVRGDLLDLCGSE